MPRLAQLAFQPMVALPRPKRRARIAPRSRARQRQRQLRLVTDAPAPTEQAPAIAPSLNPLALTAAITQDQSAVRALVLDAPLGDAMVGSGDTLIISEREPRDGELALVEGPDGTRRLRRLYHEGEVVRLQPEDRTIGSEMVRRQSIQIIGTIITIVRSQRHG